MKVIIKRSFTVEQVVGFQVAADFEARRQLSYVRKMRAYRRDLIERGIIRTDGAISASRI